MRGSIKRFARAVTLCAALWSLLSLSGSQPRDGEALAAFAVGWQGGFYHAPLLSNRSGGLRIANPRGAAGVSLLRKIDPAERYLLKLHGSGGPFLLRVREDKGDPSYFDAPVTGELEMVIAGTSRLELLFYSEKPSRYLLSALSLEPCTQCAAGDNLLPHRRVELPILARAMWQNELYGSSSAAEQGSEARIEALSRSAGIYLRRAIDPKQRYRLRISGEGHAFRVRLKEDGSEPAYFEAPASGAAEYTIDGTSRLELLLYSDEPSDYRLTGLLLEPCAQCQTDGRLSHIEHAELPSLAGAGWRNEVYGNAEVAQRGGEVSIDAMSLPAGLRLSKAIDPQQRYRLRLGGEGDALRLLIRLDDRSRSVVAAPNAEAFQFSIGNASRIEVLLYAETPAHYRLTELSLEPCPRCATTKDLVERVRREVPDLDQAEGLDKAIRLLKWSANAAIWSMDDPSGAIEAMSPEDALYDVFDRKRGGVICGGQSVFYANVLHDFGVEAFTVDFGIAGSSYNHVTVVVPYMGRHYLLDPSFASYFAEAGRPVSLEELIPINRQGGLAEIDFVDLGIENREFLAQHFPEGFCTTAPQRRGAGLFCKADGRSFFTTYLRGLGNALDAPELVRDKRFLISFLGHGVSYVGPSIDPAARQEFADMLTGFAIPVRE